MLILYLYENVEIRNEIKKTSLWRVWGPKIFLVYLHQLLDYIKLFNLAISCFIVFYSCWDMALPSETSNIAVGPLALQRWVSTVYKFGAFK